MHRRGKRRAGALLACGTMPFAALFGAPAEASAVLKPMNLELAPLAPSNTADDAWRGIAPNETFAPAKPNGRFSLDGETNGGTSGAGDAASPAMSFSADETIDRRMRFEAKNMAVDYGSLDVSLNATAQATADTLTLDRLILPGAFDGDDISAMVAGWKLRLFERFTFGSRVALADWRADASTAFRRADLADHTEGARQGAAIWNDVTAKLIDNDGLRWSLSAQLGLVDEDYRAPVGARAKASPAIAGTRAYLMTRIDVDGTSLSAAAQDIDGPSRNLQTRRVTLGLPGAQFTLYGSGLSRRVSDVVEVTHTRGVTAEFYGDDLVPANLAGAWIPTLVSVSVERNKMVALAPGLAAAPTQGPMVSADLAWNTNWGQTSLSYWQNDAAPVGSVE